MTYCRNNIQECVLQGDYGCDRDAVDKKRRRGLLVIITTGKTKKKKKKSWEENSLRVFLDIN